MKDTYYFPHDYNAQDDPKIVKLLRAHAWAAYGLYWAINERLYAENGTMAADYEQMAYTWRTEPELLKAIITKFDLFYPKPKGLFGSKSVDRRLQERREKSAKARASATAKHRGSSAAQSPAPASDGEHSERSADAQRTHSDSMGSALLERKERKEEERNEITAAAGAAVDLQAAIRKMAVDKSVEKFFSEREDALERRCAIRGEHHGRRFVEVPYDYAEAALIAPSLATMGKSQREGFEARVALKRGESNRFAE